MKKLIIIYVVAFVIALFAFRFPLYIENSLFIVDFLLSHGVAFIVALIYDLGTKLVNE